MILMVVLLVLPRMGVTFISDFMYWCVNGILSAFIRVAAALFGVAA